MRKVNGPQVVIGILVLLVGTVAKEYCHNEDFDEEDKHIQYRKNKNPCSYYSGAYHCTEGSCSNTLYTKNFTNNNTCHVHYNLNYIGCYKAYHIRIQYLCSQKEVYGNLRNVTCTLKRSIGNKTHYKHAYNCSMDNCKFDWVKRTHVETTPSNTRCNVKYRYENFTCANRSDGMNKTADLSHIQQNLYNRCDTDTLNVYTDHNNVDGLDQLNLIVKVCLAMLSKIQEGKLGDIISKKLGDPKNGTIEYLVSISSVAFGVWNVHKNNFDGHTFPLILNNSTSQHQDLNHQTITLPKNIFNFAYESNETYTSVISISYPPLKGMIADAAKSNASIGSTNIISTSIEPKLSKKLEKHNSVRINFNISANESLQPRCVFWKYDEYGNGTWSDEGCYIVKRNLEHVQCECNRLTDFSILMSVKDVVYDKEHRIALHYITLVGCIISIIFMAIMILVILFIKNLRKNHRYLIHMNLAIALIVGNISLLQNNSALNNEVSSMTVSIIMFYFYLAAFFWMLCESVFIWRAFVKVFTERLRFWKYLLLGWGTPLLVVTITASIKPKNLKSEKACWLSVEDSTIYAFVAPALFIILVGAVVLVVTLVIVFKQSKKTQSDELKTTARATLILLPLLGATWLFGVLAGFFIFVFYILTSKEVQNQIRNNYQHQAFELSSNNGNKFSNSHGETSNMGNSY